MPVAGATRPAATKRVDRLAGGRRAQLRLASAPDQLLGLGEELDLADAAAAQLDIVTGDGDLAMALDRLDLALDGMDVLDGGEIEILAPDEGAQMAQELSPRLRIAGDGARLDHGGALPILPHALVIGLGREHRHGERRRARVGTQPEIGAEDIAVLRMVLQEAHEIAHDAHEAVLQGAPAAVVHLGAVVEHDEVDVAGVVELAGAELSHAENDQARALARAIQRGQDQIARLGGAAQQMIDGGDERRPGEIAEGAGHLLQFPLPRDIGQRDQQGGAPAGLTQAAHQAGRIAVESGPREARQQIGQDSGGILR